MKNNFTKGPWRYQMEITESMHGSGKEIKYQIYNLSGDFENPATAYKEYDAKLISQSTELFEALLHARMHLSEYAHDSGEDHSIETSSTFELIDHIDFITSKITG